MRNPIGLLIQLGVGERFVPGLDSESVWIPTYHFLKPLGDGLLDGVPWEGDKGVGRVVALVPNALLLWWQCCPVVCTVDMVPFSVARVGRVLRYSVSSQTWMAAYRTMTRQRKYVYT